MKRLLVCLLAGAVVACSATAFAGSLDLARVGLHLQPKVTKNFCTAIQAGMACDATAGTETSSMVVSGNIATSYEMYIVLVDIPAGVGVQGVEMGISYDAVGSSGLDAFGEVVCADQQFAGLGWPNAGGASTYTWVSCQNTVDLTDPQGDAVAVAATIYAYAYGPDTACIVPKPSSVYGMTDCSAASSDLNTHFPQNSGCAGFGTSGGYQPCVFLGTPVEETTWGDIKSKF